MFMQVEIGGNNRRQRPFLNESGRAFSRIWRVSAFASFRLHRISARQLGVGPSFSVPKMEA
jgi:hypothetical protein